MGAMIAGVAVATLISAISGYMGAEAQEEAYNTLARASEEERREFQKAYDQSFGPGTYNDQMQKLGAKAGQQFYDMVNDAEAWNRYVNGDRAYQAPEDFSFTERDFTDDPSYKVRLQQGIDSLDQSNVASGLNLSGAALRATNDYAQDEASKEFGAAYNRAFQRYTDDRNFDFNAWQQEAQRYYDNLKAQLAGLGTVSGQGVAANTAQANALDALAGKNAAAIQQQATANAAGGLADASKTTSVLDSIAKGINTAVGAYAAGEGAAATPVNTSVASATPSNTYTLAGNMNPVGSSQQGQDFASLFLEGWNPAVNTSIPTTQNLVGM